MGPGDRAGARPDRPDKVRRSFSLRLPDFLCVGPGRTGTTWLHAVLSGHVGLPRGVKETRFWGQHYDRGVEWYADHFGGCDPELPIGEACPYFATIGARD